MVTLNDAKSILAAAEKKAVEIAQPMNVAVAEAGAAGMSQAAKGGVR